MALRSEDLIGPSGEAVIYRFPARTAQARAARLRRMQVRRRRAGLVLTTLALIALFLLATGPTGVAPASAPHAPRAVTIHQGETLWDLAERYAPASMDLRAYVDVVSDLNGLEGGPAAGMRIRLPK